MSPEWNTDRLLHGADRRATVRLMYYWLSLRRVGDLPAFADFDPRRNPVRWEICFLTCLPDGEAAVFEHVGEDFAKAGDPDVVPRPEPDGVAPGSLLGLALEGMATVCGTALPYRRDGSVARPHAALRYRSILLPFADLSGRLRYVLGAVSHCLDAADPVRLVAVERAGPIPARHLADASETLRAMAS